MPKPTEAQLDNKAQIVQLINLWRERSGLSLVQVMSRMQARGCDISRATLENRFIRLNQAPDIPPEMTLAMIATFSEGLTRHERCTAAEAIELARLTRLPIDQFAALEEFFPAEEFSQAYSRYALVVAAEPRDGPPSAVLLDLKPFVQVSQAGSNHLLPAEFAMPLYPGDVLHTYAGAHAIFFCKDSQLLFQVPELSLQDVNCQDEKGPRVLGPLKAVLQASNKAKLTPLAVAEAAIYNLAVGQPGQRYLLSLLYQGHALWAAAFDILARLVEEQGITSSYLQQQLGTLAVKIGDYAQAEKHYQAALTTAEANANLETQAAAYLGLVVTSFYQGEPERTQRLYQALAWISPGSKWVNLAKILLKREAEEIAPTQASGLAGQGAVGEAKQTLIGYVRALTEALILDTTPQLIDSFQQIADIFLSRLAAMPQPVTLRPDFAATMGLGSGAVFETMELLAAAYLTTQSLLDLEISAPLSPDQWREMLQAQAEHVARTAVGLNPPQAQAFAERYAALVSRHPDAFWALLK